MQSCTDTDNVSEWTEMRFHMTHITKEFYWVHPKLPLSLWYARRKPCTNLASRLALSPNGQKQAYGTIATNHEPILRQDSNYLQIGWNELLVEPYHLGRPLGVSKTISEPIVRLAQTMHLSCNHTNTISKWTKTRFQMAHVT
jgi:hypothetical protein